MLSSAISSSEMPFEVLDQGPQRVAVGGDEHGRPARSSGTTRRTNTGACGPRRPSGTRMPAAHRAAAAVSGIGRAWLGSSSVDRAAAARRRSAATACTCSAPCCSAVCSCPCPGGRRSGARSAASCAGPGAMVGPSRRGLRLAVWIARRCSEVWTTSGPGPPRHRSAAAAAPRARSVRSASCQPVKRFCLVPRALAVAQEDQGGHDGRADRTANSPLEVDNGALNF